MSHIKDINWKEIKFYYDLKTLWDNYYLFLDEVRYSQENSIYYNYNDSWLLTWDDSFRYRFDNNKIVDFQDLENYKYYNVVYSWSYVNIFEKDKMYTETLWEQIIELDNSWKILNIVSKEWISEYNYTSSWSLESIKDIKWNIKKIDNWFGEFKCDNNSWTKIDTNKDELIKKLEQIKIALDKIVSKAINFINKTLNFNLNLWKKY